MNEQQLEKANNSTAEKVEDLLEQLVGGDKAIYVIGAGEANKILKLAQKALLRGETGTAYSCLINAWLAVRIENAMAYDEKRQFDPNRSERGSAASAE